MTNSELSTSVATRQELPKRFDPLSPATALVGIGAALGGARAGQRYDGNHLHGDEYYKYNLKISADKVEIGRLEDGRQVLVNVHNPENASAIHTLDMAIEGHNAEIGSYTTAQAMLHYHPDDQFQNEMKVAVPVLVSIIGLYIGARYAIYRWRQNRAVNKEYISR